MDNQNFTEAIKECPSNIKGNCKALPGNKTCVQHVNTGRCPIKQLEKKQKRLFGEKV